MLNFNYFADVKKTLYDEDYARSLALMKSAGVTVLWLEIYNAGKYFASKEEIVKAKNILESMGFEVNVITIPVGHPGNSLNPDEVLDLSLPENWRYRVGIDGEKEYFCACVDKTVIAENKAVVEFCRDAGFKKLFFDDDLRMGGHSFDVIKGCFCENCLNEFAEICGKYYSREQLADACENKNALSEKWIDYNCSKITEFMKETAIDGIQTGIMIMHNGGRYHGIDIPAIKNAVPDCLFRVGELHFDDESFINDTDHKNELDSIKMHMELIGNPDICYSETTVFPPRALTPENLMKKVELAIGEGIENIFLMSGSWVMSDNYWHALAEKYDYFKKLNGE